MHKLLFHWPPEVSFAFVLRGVDLHWYTHTLNQTQKKQGKQANDQKNSKNKNLSMEMKSSIHFSVLMHRFLLPSSSFSPSCVLLLLLFVLDLNEMRIHLFTHIIHTYLFITIFSFSTWHLIAAVKSDCQNHGKHYNRGVSSCTVWLSDVNFWH